jgi:hypothetical protein
LVVWIAVKPGLRYYLAQSKNTILGQALQKYWGQKLLADPKAEFGGLVDGWTGLKDCLDHSKSGLW